MNISDALEKNAVIQTGSSENSGEKRGRETSKEVLNPTQVKNTVCNLSKTPKNPEKQANDVTAALNAELTTTLERMRKNGGSEFNRQNDREMTKVQKEIYGSRREYNQLEIVRKIAEAKEEARVAAALEAEAKQKATEIEAAAAAAASRARVPLKLDAKGIPPPPPPPVDKLPQKLATSINAATTKIARVSGESNPTGPADNFVQKQLIDELNNKLLLRRADEANITDKNTTDPLLMTTTDRPLPEWKKELAEHKASYARDEVLRKAAEAEEEARVARNLEEEEGKRNIEAQQKAAEAAEAAKAAEVRNALVHRDERGIPLPPPLPAYK
ncbi:hypothetical protein [Erwinia sp. ErVv1]|uniref:hypothetical protein n=1 Tax=Erwinia sp. ErVv1 TaxID=1603299 RepID=UPI00082EEA22|nr:hypothetical protein [Erwinia sp. ErVv1]